MILIIIIIIMIIMIIIIIGINNNYENLVLDQDRKFYLISWNIYITYLLVNL